MFKERQLEQALDSRKLGGYFSRVISVHPLAGLFESGSAKFGEPAIIHLDDAHIFVEGKIGFCQTWKLFAPLSFLLVQIKLVSLLYKMCKKDRVDVIRVGDPYYVGLMGWVLSRLLCVPLVVRIGSNYDKCYAETGKPAMPRLFRKRWIEKIIEKFVLRRADLIAGANLDNLNFALANGAKKEFSAIFRYGNLIHPSHRIPPKERPSADGILSDIGLLGSNFAIYIGRLEPVKLPDHVILIISGLRKKGCDLKALMIGDGSIKSELIAMTKRLGIEDHIIFVGNKDQQWISSVLPRASIVLSPHTGRALTEAAFSEVPVVAYDIDWQSELIRTGETGELVEYKNLSAMVDSAAKVLKNLAYAEKIGRNLRKKVEEMMDTEKLNEHEKNEYERLFNRKKYKENKT